jgi:hypothetical protein
VLWVRPARTYGAGTGERSDPTGKRSHRAKFFSAPTYDILPIFDCVSGGDSFMGDFNVVSVSEVETLMAGDASGRVSR